MIKTTKIAIIGLGYVGTPLAVAFSKYFPVLGFDINPKRVAELTRGVDSTHELSAADLNEATQLSFTAQSEQLHDCTIFIITVPTPIDQHKRPDLQPLYLASETVGKYLKPNDIVIYESTVYPGCTEEVCVPILQQASNLRFNSDFFVGYSPERVNPGDKSRPLTSICKITSGSTPQTAKQVDTLYRTILTVDTFPASSIKVAEAAKVIENTQRDLNIALVNELAMLFNKLDIDTREVLDAAGSKWNFLPFSPGLVGGHCISVDPYYLTHKAQEIGFHPEFILAGRRINDSMAEYVAAQIIKLMTRKKIAMVGANILVLGFTFKENCSDIRNTQIAKLINELHAYHAHVDICDPLADREEVKNHYQLSLMNTLPNKQYDAIILAVAHDAFIQMPLSDITSRLKTPHIIYDLRHALPKDMVDGRL